MPRLLPLFAMLVCSSAGPARAMPWEVGANGGAGALLGTGWDANHVGPSLLLSGGPRLRYVAVHGGLLAHQLLLRAAQRDKQLGQTVGILLSVPFYPLGARYAVEPYIAPSIGLTSTLARVTEGEKVELATRAWLLGASLGAYWVINARYSVGASVLGARLLVRRACIRVPDELTACGVQTDSTFVGSLLASFRVTFGEARPRDDGAASQAR